jgi:hypothetical protein
MSVQMTAQLSACGLYRYRLRREWGSQPPHARAGQTPKYQNDTLPGPDEMVAFVMLNPSTADHTLDDPTIRRCIDFAYHWGYGALEVVNLFALRSTDPKALRGAVGPVGACNDGAIIACAREASMVVCAWGTDGALDGRGDRVRAFLADYSQGEKLYHLGLTKGGQPRHPLYLKADTLPVCF